MLTTYAYAMNKLYKNEKGFSFVELIIIIFVLALIGATGWFVYKEHHKSTTTNTSKVSGEISTNIWTGKGNNYNWNDTANWSLGVPTNGQILEIDVTNVTQPTNQYGPTSFAFQDNLLGLVINKLLIYGEVDSINFSVTGDPLSITNGIVDSITQTPGTGDAIPRVEFDNTLNLNGSQTIQTTADNMLTLLNSSNRTDINIGNATLAFDTSGSSQIDINGPISGTGEILFPNSSITPNSGVLFENTSPNFNGTVSVGNGDIISVNYADTSNSSSLTAFGNSNIDVMNGGAISVVSTNTNSFTISNNISMGGNGVQAQTPNSGYTGAIGVCLSTSDDGCDGGVKVNLTGKLTLSGNTELGAFYVVDGGSYGGTGSITSGNSVTYDIAQPIAGNYSVTSVPNSYVLIQK